MSSSETFQTNVVKNIATEIFVFDVEENVKNQFSRRAILLIFSSSACEIFPQAAQASTFQREAFQYEC